MIGCQHCWAPCWPAESETSIWPVIGYLQCWACCWPAESETETSIWPVIGYQRCWVPCQPAERETESSVWPVIGCQQCWAPCWLALLKLPANISSLMEFGWRSIVGWAHWTQWKRTRRASVGISGMRNEDFILFSLFTTLMLVIS